MTISSRVTSYGVPSVETTVKKDKGGPSSESRNISSGAMCHGASPGREPGEETDTDPARSSLSASVVSRK